MNDLEFDAIALKFLEIIRNSKDPAKALEIAIDVCNKRLAAYEKEGKQ